MDADTVALGMVGLGGWGKNVVRAFAGTSRCQLKYICDRDERSLDAHSRLFPQATPTTDFQQILADDSIQAVAIATPADSHFPLAEAALRAGKHVYVEKPMTLQAADAETLLATAEEMNRKLMVGHLLEYHPAVEMMKQYVDADELGEIHYMYCQRVNLGVVRQHENAFWSLAPHDISIILYLFGAEPDRISANGQCYLQPGVEDVVFANLGFPDGRMAQIHVSWLDPHKERKMVLVGSKKMLVFDDMQAAEKIRIFDKGARMKIEAVSAPACIGVRHGDIHIPFVPNREPLGVETQHFIDCILNDTQPRSDGHDGLRVVRILEQVEQQLRGTIPTTQRDFTIRVA